MEEEVDNIVGRITQISSGPRYNYPPISEDAKIFVGKPAKQMSALAPLNDMHFDYMPYLWRVDIFGDNFSFVFETQVDRFWVRFWTRFFFRSNWTRL